MERISNSIISIPLFSALLFFFVTPCYALDITLAWDANTEPALAGYKIYYDMDSGHPYDGIEAQDGFSPINMTLDQDEDIDPNTVQYTIHDMPDGIYYFSVTAYRSEGFESGYSNEVNTVSNPANERPMADAGPDQSVNEGTIVLLNGLNSTDPGDGIAIYSWQQTGGAPVVLLDPWAPETTFTAPDVSPEGESLSFQLTITDNGGLKSSDECIVNVIWINEPPTAEAGLDQGVFTGDIVTLDASMSSDVDNDIATYFWEQTGGPAVSLSGSTSMQATFVAPDVSDAGYSLKFLLTVSDDGGLKATDTCVVNVEGWSNSPPTAEAGLDQEVYEGDMVALDGSGSTDPDDGIDTYIWAQKTGTPVTLHDPRTAKTTFNAPEVETDGEPLTFELTVTDKGGLKSTDNCNVKVNQNKYSTSLIDFWVTFLTIELQRKGANYRAKAYVTILDEYLSFVKGATVTVNWALNGRQLNTASDVTDRKGVATLISNPDKAQSGDIFTVTVTGITKDGYSYDPSSDIKTTDSIVLP
jgi:hypothetical protein